MKRFYLISESSLHELLLSAALNSQKWPLSSCFPHLTQISTQHYAPKYNVFLNFRGRDTRRTFVHYLYEALSFKGITAFKDDKSVNKGDPIGRELFRAIDECQIAIVILSKNYAASEWCLEELVKIMERKKRLTIFPVFYDVCPSEVRNLKGSFGGAFAEHENKPSKVKTWKNALCKAAGISGFDLRNYNGDESKCIEDIVEEVCKKLEAIKREKYEERKTVAKCKLTHRKQRMVKSHLRPNEWRVVCMYCVVRETTPQFTLVLTELGRTMVARAEESPGSWRGLPMEVCQGKTTPQLGQTAVVPHITIKVKSSTPRPNSLWSSNMYLYSVGTKSGWNWIGMGVGFSITNHTTVLRVVVYMHFVPCQQTTVKENGKVMVVVVVRLYLLAFCSMSTRKQPGGWMDALVQGELRKFPFAFAFALLTLILTIIICQGMATKAKPHLVLRGFTFTILRVLVYSVSCQQTRQILLWTMAQRVFVYSVSCQQTRQILLWTMAQNRRHSFCVIELAQTVEAAGWASPPYDPHQSLQTIEPYIRERKTSYSLDVG